MLGRRIGTGPAENPARPLPMRDAARPGSAALAENPARPLSALEAARNEALSSSDSAVHHRPPPLPPRSTAPVSSPPGDPLAQRYAEYQQGFSALLVEVRQRLERADSTRRAEVLDELLRKYPDLGQRSELRSLLVELGLNPLRSGVPEMEDWLRRLTDNMFPPPGVPVNIALAMERIGALLEVFGTAFIELRGAHEQFCNEMSLDRAPDSTMLRTTSNVRVALAYLLNSSTDSSSKVEELARGMADFALHQVALVNAVVDGARALLEELSPKGLREQHDKTGKKPKRGMFSGMFSSESDALVARYETAFAELLDEDRFTRKLFGRAFARKYYAIMGGRDTSPSLRQRD
jgi:hypothetical protein